MRNAKAPEHAQQFGLRQGAVQRAQAGPVVLANGDLRARVILRRHLAQPRNQLRRDGRAVVIRVDNPVIAVDHVGGVPELARGIQAQRVDGRRLRPAIQRAQLVVGVDVEDIQQPRAMLPLVLAHLGEIPRQERRAVVRVAVHGVRPILRAVRVPPGHNVLLRKIQR
jgi:hypothetical protein